MKRFKQKISQLFKKTSNMYKPVAEFIKSKRQGISKSIIFFKPQI